jgi:hypothetical protein
MRLFNLLLSHVKTRATAPHPEIELLLCCARTQVDAGTAQRIQTLVQQPVDWGQLLQRADQQGLIPLLYQNLKAICATMIPPAVLDQLSQQAFTNAARNMLRTRELLRLLSLFKAHGIPAFPFKGPVLAATVYGNLSLRQFGDLDIMIHERDIGKAKDLLISQGYQMTTAEQQERYRLDYCDYTFVSQDGNICVELHWRFLPPSLELLFPFFSVLDLEHVWSRLQTTSLSGIPVPTLSLEDQLLYLCLHGCKHLWCRLFWLCDIAELIRTSPQLEWGWVLEQANRLGSRRVLLLSLSLAYDLLGTTLPPPVVQSIQADPAVRSLAAQLRKRLLDTAFPYQISRYQSFILFPFYFKMIERMRDRMLFLKGMFSFLVIPNKMDRENLRLPPWLEFLYFIIRPIRLVTRYAPLVRQKLSHKLKN